MDWRIDNGAVCIIHPWEAGRDNAPDWDEAMAGIDPVGVGEYVRRDTSHVDSAMRPTKYDYVQPSTTMIATYGWCSLEKTITGMMQR